MKLLSIFVCVLFMQACFFLKSPSSRLRKAESVKPLDAIIVPGLPLKNGKWDSLMKARVLWSVFLLQRGYAKNVIYSGNAVYTPWVEGTAMSFYAQKLGVLPQRIFVDSLAEHSTENLFYSMQIAGKKGFNKIAVATDPFQCAMLYKYAKKNFNNTILFLPVIYDSLKPMLSFECEIDTQACRKNNFVALPDRENYRDRLKGTRGRRVN